MRYGILGPLEVSDDGRAIELTGPRQRALLAILLLSANRVVSSDALVDALWEGDAPATAAKGLQVHVSQLRKLIGKERLRTKAPGYVLLVEPDELDLARFERLREEGRLREALALWRGPPLAEFAYHRFAQAEIARLEDLRLACLEERIEEDLARGRHAELIGYLEGLAREHPLREQLRRQQMLALYRARRQAEALDVYQAARRMLVEELGIEPGRALRELHQAILRQDPSLDLEVDDRADEEADEASAPAFEPEPGRREARKTVTSVFVGVTVGSATGETLDPEALRRITGRALALAEGAIRRHGGTVEIVTGEGLTALFGLPAVHEDDALRALRAALEARDALLDLGGELSSERGLDLACRLGVSTGEVVTGLETGSGLRTTGEPLTRSTRLGQLAQPGEVLFDDPARRLVRETVTSERVEDAWRLLEVAAAGTVGRRRESPMVGRQRERRRLHDAFEQAVGDRSCQLFTVLGSAGVGKSRLVEEFLAAVAAGALVARGRCLPYGEGITYWPVTEIVRDALGLEDTCSTDELMARMSAALGEEQGAEPIAQRIAEMIGLADVSVGVEGGFPAVRALFEALARERPLVLVFDDIHWGEPTFLDLVEYLADWTRTVPVLLVCLARPELLDLRPGWAGGKLNATTSLLEPLSEHESIELIGNLDGAALDEGTRQRIISAAEGNPLFVEEMLALALEAGGGADDFEVPPTIQALLAARLDRLDDEEQAVIERAAVVGKVFYEQAVFELTPSSRRTTVADALASLVRKELIRPDRPSLGQRTYRFRHLLIRDAAYDTIPKEARADLHERFGRWLEHALGDRSVEYEEVVGYHLEQAYSYRVELGTVDEHAKAVAAEAATRLGAAGRRAFIRSDASAGINLVSRAVALLRPSDPVRVELIPTVRVVQGAAGDMTWADRALTEAVEAAATSGNRLLAAHALVQRGLLRLFTEADVTADELIETADRAIEVFESLGDELGLARGWRLKAQAHYLARRAGSCVEASEHALPHARRAADEFEESEIVEWLAIALFLGPVHAADAAERCERLAAENAGRPFLQLHLLSALGGLESMRGHRESAAEVASRCRVIMDEIGVGGRSFGAAPDEDPVVAEQELRLSYEGFARLGEKRHFNSICAHLAIAVYAQGRYDEAEQLTRECEAAARPNDVHSHILWRSTRARVLARRGQFEPALRLAQEAVEYAAASDFHSAHGDALMALAEIQELEGDSDVAATTAADAARLYALKGNVVGADRARGVPIVLGLFDL
jgi:DNA-binding SARP family transcriptional activator